MPTWPAHILMAKKINKTLNLGDDFIIGNIVTDTINHYLDIKLSNYITHHESHYHYDTNNEFTKKININLFIDKYKQNLNNPFVVGYLTHLLTDSYFNEYAYNKKYINETSHEEKTKFKQQDFAAFGDFLINNNDFGPLLSKSSNTYENLKILNEIDYQENDIDNIIKKLNQLITIKEVSQATYLIFSNEELTRLFDECYNYIINFLYENNLIIQK